MEFLMEVLEEESIEGSMKVLVKGLRCVGREGEMVMGGKEKGTSDDTIRGVCMWVVQRW